MKIVAGNALNHRKPMHAAHQAAGEHRQVVLAPVMNVIPM